MSTPPSYEIPIVEHTPFPAASKQAAGLIGGVATNISSIYFADKIMVTISQSGRLSQWIHVPLSTVSPTTFDTALPSADNDTLPLIHLNPRTLIGGGGEQRANMGYLYASHIATMIATRNPEERRTVVVGLGLEEAAIEMEAWFDMIVLLQKVV